MKIIDAGHHYQLATLDGEALVELIFVKRFRGTHNHSGTTNQEVLRVLIDRLQTIDAEKPHPVNTRLLALYREALVLHEVRALEYKVHKGELNPEELAVSSKDGHFIYERSK